jgi:hypothetical protein
MRIKNNWFKPGRIHSPEELAGAVSFVVYRIADNALKNTRKAKFEISIGTQYFDFLTEYLLFLIQVTDRIAYRQLALEGRHLFTSTLANRVAETHAENESRLLGGELSEYKSNFISQLNRRSGEYAEFEYTENGSNFSFIRYLGYCMTDIMDEEDSGWIMDQLISIEAPQAVELLEKTFRGFQETEPRPPRRHASLGGD